MSRILLAPSTGSPGDRLLSKPKIHQSRHGGTLDILAMILAMTAFPELK